MALRYYDEALLKKIRDWVKDPNITIISPDDTRNLFQYTADVNNDKPIKLPLISLRRGKTVDILSTVKTPLTFDGATINVNNEKSSQLNAIPVSLTYQLDIYCRYYDEADEYARNFIFNFINYPKLNITIPYNNANIEHTSNVRLSNTLEDNSDIPERMVQGQFTRMTLNLTIDDAYLFSVSVRDNIKLQLTIENL